MTLDLKDYIILVVLILAVFSNFMSYGLGKSQAEIITVETAVISEKVIVYNVTDVDCYAVVKEQAEQVKALKEIMRQIR